MKAYDSLVKTIELDTRKVICKTFNIVKVSSSLLDILKLLGIALLLILVASHFHFPNS